MNRVFFWAPNIIGYLRIAFLIAALYMSSDKYVEAMVFYAVSQLLDALDGTIARAFNQCSQFGALLDMLTDRMSTTCLLIVIAIRKPEQQFFYMGLIVLDLVAHWAQMYSTLMVGGKSHKKTTNPILRLYYAFPFLLIFCVGNEAYIIATYLRLFNEGPIVGGFPLFRIIAVAAYPIFVGKNLINAVQLMESSRMLADLDRPKRN